MGTLTFQWDKVRSLMERTRTAAAKDRRLVYGDLCTPAYFLPDVPKGTEMVESSDQLNREKVPPGLVFVGDQGIYLMSGDATENTALYAEECDPTKMPFDEWWDAKQELFGGDDGTERLELSMLDEMAEQLAKSALKEVPPEQLVFIIRLTEDQMSFSIKRHLPMFGRKSVPCKHA